MLVEYSRGIITKFPIIGDYVDVVMVLIVVVPLLFSIVLMMMRLFPIVLSKYFITSSMLRVPIRIFTLNSRLAFSVKGRASSSGMLANSIRCK